MMAIRAGFEPFRALGSPIASRTKTMLPGRPGILGKAKPPRRGSKPARISYRANRAPGRAEFFALPSADQLISVQNPLPDWVG
jgi:hypothetical protein